VIVPLDGGFTLRGGRGGGASGKEPGTTGDPEIAVSVAANKFSVGSDE